MEKERQRNMILNENMWKLTFQLAWPAVTAMVLYGLNTVFDAIFVGRFVGESALAGVSLAYPLTQITLGFGSLIGVGAGSALSIAIGEGDEFIQKKLLGNVNSMIIIISILFMFVGLVFTDDLVRMMGGSGTELIYGSAYFRITVFGAVFWIAGLAGNMIVRAEGKMKSAAVMMAIGLVINIIANYVLIVMMDMGVEGAAIGTNIGMMVYTIVSLYYFAGKRPSFEARPFSLHRDSEIIKKILSMGIPSMIMSIMSLLQAVVVLNALTAYGSTGDIAFYGVVFRIFTFMLTPIFGLMRALQPVVGINYGAKKYERVIHSVKVFGMAATLLMLPLWAVMMFSPLTLLNLMLPDKVFLAADIMNFRLFMMLLPLLPTMFMGMTFFPAINKGKIASLIGITRQLVFYLPVMLVMPRLFGIRWVYYGAFIIDLVMILWAIYLMRREFKMLKNSSVEKLVTDVQDIS